MLRKKKRTLEELEKETEQRWEEDARRLVQAIAARECVDFAELYPHLVDYSFGDGHVDASFKFPGHTVIKLFGGYGNRPPLHLTDKGLEGDYNWMVWVCGKIGTPSFTGCYDLGEALLLARWSHEQDDKALWR